MFGRLEAGNGEDELFPVLVEFGDTSSPSLSSVGRESLRLRFVESIAGTYHHAFVFLS